MMAEATSEEVVLEDVVLDVGCSNLSCCVDDGAGVNQVTDDERISVEGVLPCVLVECLELRNDKFNDLFIFRVNSLLLTPLVLTSIHRDDHEDDNEQQRFVAAAFEGDVTVSFTYDMFSDNPMHINVLVQAPGMVVEMYLVVKMHVRYDRIDIDFGVSSARRFSWLVACSGEDEALRQEALTLLTQIMQLLPSLMTQELMA